MNDNVITGQEYCIAIGLTPANDEEPSGFKKFQGMAIDLLRKVIAQSHLIPRNHDDIDDLRDVYKNEVIRGIAYQICFMHDNELYYENGYVNFGEGSSTPSQSNSGQQPKMLIKIFRDIFPNAYDCFDRIGGTYSSLENHLEPKIFYKGEK